jgi:hypothetical protein
MALALVRSINADGAFDMAGYDASSPLGLGPFLLPNQTFGL